MRTVIALLLLIPGLSLRAGAQNGKVISHDLELIFNLEEHSFKAIDNMVLIPQAQSIFFLLNRDFEVKKIRVNGKKLKFKVLTDFDWTLFEEEIDADDSLFFNRTVMVKAKLKKKHYSLDSLKLKVEYRGALYDTLKAASFSRMKIADQSIGLIGEEGIYLSPEAVYYPYFDDNLAYFSASTYTPAGYKTVTDGKLAAMSDKRKMTLCRWEGTSPTDGIYISGAKWEMFRDKTGDTDIYGFFFPEDTALGDKYVKASKRYIEMYEELLGDYPHPKFAVVENFFPTGYGMPSWTLLGRTVVRLPWIVNISLGHEVCHNWWGNGVFVDYESGNWCEGLTTYCADYLYKERKSPQEAAKYRRNLNQDYSNYVREANDFPLSEFTSRTETYTRAIGYGKSAMVIHMLRIQLGEKDFWGGLRRFYRDNLWHKASWEDIREAFEDQTKDDLGWFFKQWVENTGAPRIEASDIELSEREGQHIISVGLQQTVPPFELKVPVTIHYSDREDTRRYEISPGEHEITIACDTKPEGVSIDPHFDVFRVLDRDEYPASLSEVIGADNQIIVLPSKVNADKGEAYRELAETLNGGGKFRIVEDSQVSGSEIRENSLLLFGAPYENTLYPVLERTGLKWEDWISYIGEDNGFMLMGESFHGADIASMITVRNPVNRNQSIAAFQAGSAMEIKRVGRKLFHYGKYSYLAFESGKNKLKGNWAVTRSPLQKKFD